MRLSPAVRLTRALVGASVATGVALGSHVAAGAPMPSAAGVLVPWALSAAVWLQVSGRAASLWRLALGVGVSQWLFHSLFSLGAGGATVTSQGEHTLHGDVSLTVVATGHVGHGGATMTAAHLLAAALTTAFLFRMDVLWALLTRVWASVRGAITPAMPARHVATSRRRLAPPASAARAAPRRIVTVPAVLRGPPLPVS